MPEIFLENHTKVLRRIVYLFAISWSLAACGRERATATPIPASVVRPVQPTPVYARSSAFRLTTPTPTAAITPVTPITPTRPGLVQLPSASLTSAPDTTMLLLAQTPSALGIVTVDATLLEIPNGQAVAQLPSGTVLTLTGKTKDGRYLAAYTNAGATGWINPKHLTLFGADDLQVVAESRGPGVAATLVAAAMQPVQVLDDLLTATPESIPGP